MRESLPSAPQGNNPPNKRPVPNWFWILCLIVLVMLILTVPKSVHPVPETDAAPPINRLISQDGLLMVSAGVTYGAAWFPFIMGAVLMTYGIYLLKRYYIERVPDQLRSGKLFLLTGFIFLIFFVFSYGLLHEVAILKSVKEVLGL